jgi:Lhr-like helicase
MTIEKEQLEDAVMNTASKIRSNLHLINDTIIQIDNDLADIEDLALILGRIDEPTVTEEEYKKWLEEEDEK